jgi:NADPH-dependent 7-cyano-7-deazaguanine reductase QueF
MTAQTVPVATPGVRCITVGPFIHRCPVTDEIDHGTLLVHWMTTDVTIELHWLAHHLKTAWADVHVTHEDACQQVADKLAALGVDDVLTRFTGETAGLAVKIEAHGILREPDIDAERA